MNRETIDKIILLSETRDELLKFVKDKSILIGKGSYSSIFGQILYVSVEDKIFAERVNELAKQRLEEIEKEIEEL